MDFKQWHYKTSLCCADEILEDHLTRESNNDGGDHSWELVSCNYVGEGLSQLVWKCMKFRR